MKEISSLTKISKRRKLIEKKENKISLKNSMNCTLQGFADLNILERN